MNDLIPLTDEQAKAIQEVAKFGSEAAGLVRGLGGYLRQIFGTVPEDMIGLLIGDSLRFKRAENMARTAKRAFEILEARGVEQLQPAPLSVALPLLEGAAEEDREELTELWAKLLAAAADPDRAGAMRQSFIRAVKQMDPLDALVLDRLPESPMSLDQSPVGRVAALAGASMDQAEISMLHLIEIGILRDTYTRRGDPVASIQRVDYTVFGRELVRLLK